MDIKVEVRVSVTDAQGGDFVVVQDRERQFFGNPLLGTVIRGEGR